MKISKLLIYLSYLFLLWGNGINHGFYNLPAFLAVFASFVLIFASVNIFTRKRDVFLNVPFNEDFLLKFILLFSMFFSWLWYGGFYQQHGFGYYFSQFFLFGIFLTYFILFAILKKNTVSPALFWLTVGVVFLLRLIMIQTSSDPTIDVFRSLKYGTLALIQLKNPYQEIYPAVYSGKILNYFSYFPGVLLFFLPFNLLLGDPRYGIIFAEFCIVMLTANLFKRKKISEVIGMKMILIFLFYPITFFLIEQSFIDILIVLGILILFYYLKIQTKINYFIIYAISIFIMNTRQIFFFLFPLFLWRTKILVFRKTLLLYLLTFVSILPFLIISFKDFFYDVFFIYFQPPQGTSYNAALNLKAFLANQLKLNVYANLFFLLIAFYSLYLFFFIKKDVDLTEMLLRFFFGFFLLGSLAFSNHWYFVSCLFWLFMINKFLSFKK